MVETDFEADVMFQEYGTREKRLRITRETAKQEREG